MTNKLWSDPPALALFLLALALLVAPKPSLRSLALATAIVGVGIAFRYAMIGALLLPLFVAWKMRIRWLVPAVGSCAAVMVLVIANRVSGVSPLPLAGDFRAFQALATQILPAQAGVIGLVAVAGTVAICSRALPIAGVWIGVYIAFLFVAQSVAHPSFTFDLRILVLLYPAMILVIAAAADKAPHQRMTVCLTAILAIAAGRALHGIVPHPVASPSCVTREQLVAGLKSRSFPSASRISSNAQGLVWYALRRPIAANPKPGDVVITFDPARVCEGVIEGASR